MALTDANLTLHEAKEFLALNGIDWSFGWIKTQVACGKIPSQKIFNSRVVPRSALMEIVRQKKERVA